MMDQQQNVMPAMQQEAGQGAKKKASQIISDYVVQQTGDKQQVNQVAAGIDALVKKKIARLVQFGNTVFLAIQHGQGTVEVHMFSQESPKVMAGRIKQAYEWAKQHGFKKITSSLTDEQQIGVVKAAGIPYTLNKAQMNDGKKLVPCFNMEMEVK